MGVMEYSPTTVAPLLLRNLVASIFMYADKSILNLAEKHKLLEFIRCILISSFLFFLRLLPSFNSDYFSFHPSKKDDYVPALTASGGGSGSESAIARALFQLLSTVIDIPVESRKYEVVRSLAERIIDENQRDNIHSLREINCTVLSAVFSRTLSRLEDAVAGVDMISGTGPVQNQLNRVLRAGLSRIGWGKEEVNRSGCSAEKLAAELHWMAQKMAACGFVEEAVGRWASAQNLGWLALTAEPRLQGSLVKIAVFLFKQTRQLRLLEEEEKEQQRQTMMKMLLAWLPLLCRGSNGTDTPILSLREKAETEKVIEEMIDMLEYEEEQEQVLSLWLHHFTHCSSSDWPNLHASYARWYASSRRRLLLLQ